MKRSPSFPSTPEERSFVLIRARNLKMARSVHASVRGSTTRFYEWLESAEARAAPDRQYGFAATAISEIWVPSRTLTAGLQSRSATSTRPLWATRPLIRLGLSLAMAARGSDLPGVTTARMLEKMMEGYGAALLGDVTDTDPAEHQPESVRVVMREATSRSWKILVRERIQDEQPTIPLGKRFWPLAPAEREDLRQLFQTERLRKLATALRRGWMTRRLVHSAASTHSGLADFARLERVGERRRASEVKKIRPAGITTIRVAALRSANVMTVYEYRYSAWRVTWFRHRPRE